jgi:hypothetical protein
MGKDLGGENKTLIFTSIKTRWNKKILNKQQLTIRRNKST